MPGQIMPFPFTTPFIFSAGLLGRLLIVGVKTPALRREKAVRMLAAQRPSRRRFLAWL